MPGSLGCSHGHSRPWICCRSPEAIVVHVRQSFFGHSVSGRGTNHSIGTASFIEASHLGSHSGLGLAFMSISMPYRRHSVHSPHTHIHLATQRLSGPTTRTRTRMYGPQLLERLFGGFMGASGKGRVIKVIGEGTSTTTVHSTPVVQDLPCVVVVCATEALVWPLDLCFPGQTRSL